MNEKKGIFLMLCTVVAVSAAQVFFKLESSSFLAVIWITLGIIGYGVSLFTTLGAYQVGRMSIMYPISALCFPVTALAGLVVFGETLVWKQWVALALILAGTTLIGMDTAPVVESQEDGVNHTAGEAS